ncbi:hypothetical protein KDL45_07195, partial [bacterium]|nr:hypothetical protein [bacterium]
MTSPMGDLIEGTLVETVEPKQLHAKPFAGLFEERAAASTSMTMALPDLEPGDEAVAAIVFTFTYESESYEDVFDAVEEAGYDALLDETYQWWSDWTAKAAKVTTPDPKFDDMIEGFAVTIKTQQAATGATCVMSEYSRTWTRDTMGPLLLYPAIGHADDARDMLDYYYKAAVQRGNIANSLPANLVFDDLPSPPDWENLPTMTGREQAEQPSYLPIQYHLYFQQTGDLAPIAERWGMLKHALIHQNFQEGCLLPFSGDETFRELIGIGFGYVVGGTVYEDLWYSANSMFLFVRAAEIMADFAERLGYDDDKALFEQMAADVRTCTEDYFWLEDEGFYALMIDQVTLEPVRRPYEDVNTKPLWVGYGAGDDEKQISNMLAMMEQIGAPDRSYIQTPPHILYKFLLEKLGSTLGVFSGMTQGYYLSALTKMDHPAAEAAFDIWRVHGNDSGNVSEAMIRDDYSRVAYLREPFGFLSDLTSRYRPWEGGIYAKSMVDYVFGVETNVADGTVRVAPHLPGDWTHSRFGDVPFGEDRFDLAVEDAGGVRRVTVENGTGAFALTARVAVPGQVTGVSINDTPADPDDYTILDNWGDQAVEFNAAVAPSATIELEVAYE